MPNAVTKIFKSALEKAQAEAQRIATGRDKLDQQRRQAFAAITELEAKMPAALTDALLAESNGSDPIEVSRELHQQLERARSVIAMVDRTESELVTRLASALRQALEAEAQQADSKADQAEEKLRQHEARLRSALDGLRAIEGCDYVPASTHIRAMADLMTRDGKSTIADPIRFTLPVSERLAVEVQQLRLEAAAIRQRQVRSHGAAKGYTVEALLEQMHQPGVISPSEAALRLWCDSEERNALARWKQSGDDQLAAKARGYTGVRTEFSVSWKDGVISSGSARIQPAYESFNISSLGELTQGPAFSEGMTQDLAIARAHGKVA